MIRARAVLLAALVLLAACGDDDDDASVADGAATTTTAVGGDPGTTGSTAPQDESTEPGSSGAPETTVAAAPELGGSPGSGASWYLRPDGAAAVQLEVISESGAEPSDDTVTHVGNVLVEVSGKGVTPTRASHEFGRDVWTSDDIRSAAGAPDGALRILFVHGELAESDSVLGVAVRADVAAIFVDRVRDSASPLIGSGAIETAVTTHELGHLLGLVDLHLHTGRGDPEHPGHSTNRGSVMYWAVESSLVTDLLAGGPPRTFDDADRADLAAIRGGQ